MQITARPCATIARTRGFGCSVSAGLGLKTPELFRQSDAMSASVRGRALKLWLMTRLPGWWW